MRRRVFVKGPHGHKIDMDKELDPTFDPPEHVIGYLAPSVGSFTLEQERDPDGDRTDKGHAQFVWHHLHHHGSHSRFDVDWHDDPMKYVGGLINNEYWCYQVCETAPEEDGPRYIAFAREIMADSHGKNDEGYRILYVDQGYAHLWAWDAKTFHGHEDHHDDHVA